MDPMYWMLVGPALLLAFWAQIKVKSAFSKYSRVGTRSGLSGAEAAQEILRASGIDGVGIEPSRGWLSDHYDPRARRLRLSPEVFQGRSISAIGVAAHEVGHAIQHSRGYFPLHLRTSFVPAANAGSILAWVFIPLGFMLGRMGLIHLGIILFSIAVVAQIITLPVEFNASRRAKAALMDMGLVTLEEAVGVIAVLSAAALTYVAAAVAALTQLLYFILRSSSRR
jgi:hypothetical protein